MESANALNRWVFGALVAVLGVVVVAGPFVLGNALGLDARTPANAAYEALSEQGLDPVSAEGKVMKPDDGPESASIFDFTAGTTTKDVPFKRNGAVVHCTVHVPDNPADTTADCSG